MYENEIIKKLESFSGEFEKNIIEYRILMLIKMVDNVATSEITKLLSKLNITATQGSILGYILSRENGTLYPRDLEERFRLSRPTITGILKRLTNSGFIELIPDEDDRRYKHITATDKARNVRDEMDVNMRKHRSRIFKNISEEDQDVVYRVLETILSNIKNIKNEGKAE